MKVVKYDVYLMESVGINRISIININFFREELPADDVL
jgi:hypothetical protein